MTGLRPSPYTMGMDSLLYFVEDDYLHLSHSLNLLEEIAHAYPNDYYTLYDHPDKYRGYTDLESKIAVVQDTHWRTVPSTTNTFACRKDTLVEDLSTHQYYSLPAITQDHAKFVALGNNGRRVWSPIPSASTHVENNMFAPGRNWETINACYSRDYTNL